MKRLVGILLLLGVALTQSGSVTQYHAVVARKKAASVLILTASDDFTSYADGADLSAQTNWSATQGDIIIAKNGGNAGIDANQSSTNNIDYWNAGTWSADQYAEITLVNVWGTTVSNFGVSVRCDANNAYMATWTGGTIYLNKLIAGSGTGITSVAQTFSAGDKMRLEVTGTGASTRLTVKVDTGGGWSTVISSVDPGSTYLNSGNPGVAAWSIGTNGTHGGFWSASDL